MRPIQIQKQVSLPLAKCIELVLSGVRFRLFRAAITVTIIALAATFLMTMMVESLITRRVAASVHLQTAGRREFDFWLSRLSTPLTEATVTAELAGAQDSSPRWAEFKAWGGLSDPQIKQLASVAERQLQYEAYFDSLDLGQRRPLIGSAKGAAVFADLQAPEALAAFEKELKNISRPMPQAGGFRGFLTEWKDTAPLRQGIMQGNSRSVEEAHKLFGGRGTAEILAGADESLLGRLAALGFQLDAPTLQRLRRQAAYAVTCDRLVHIGAISQLKLRLAQRLGVPILKVDQPQLFATAGSSAGAEWLIEQVSELKHRIEELRSAHAPATEAQERPRLSPEEASLVASAPLIEQFPLDPGQIEEAADYQLSQDSLATVEATVRQASGAQAGGGFSNRTLWLIVVSFVVCIVGIANAMLMSVTERFREIATMKCLGATDGFILINFILESVMQGITGGLIGVVAGAVLGLLRAAGGHGTIVLRNIPVTEMLVTAGLSFAVSVIVSALAAVYPALVAARLAPMEAMRIE